MSWRASTSSVLLAILRCWTKETEKEVESQILENLELVTELDLGKSQPGAEGVLGLVKALQKRAFPRLEILDLSINKIDDKGVIELTTAINKGNLSNLRNLELRNVHMGPGGARAIAKCFESGSLACLHTLRLDSNDIEDSGLIALAEAFQAGHAPSLRSLGLGQGDPRKLMGGDDNGIEGFHIHGARALGKAFQSGNLSKFEALHFDSVVGDEGVVAVMKGLEAGLVGPFRSLHLSSNGVGVEGIRTIARVLQSEHFSTLISLSLPYGITLRDDNSLKALSETLRSPSMNKLQTLEFMSNPCSKTITEQGLLELAAILEAGHLPSLQKLNCRGACNSLASSHAFIRSYMKNPFLVAKILVDWPTSPLRNSAEGLRRRNVRSAGSLKVMKDEPLVAGHHGKIFLLGHPKVGKTTLKKSLCSLTGWKALAASVRMRDTGGGEDVGRRIDVSTICHKKLSLGVWDLQGQQEYDVLHSGFLSNLVFGNCHITIFVIVCSVNYRGQGNNTLAKKELDYWTRYISSISARGVEDCKPLVFVVLNSFPCDQSCHNYGEWTSMISIISTDFNEFFNIHPYPFILSALNRKDVKQLKSRLLETASNMLQGKRIPRICRKIQERIGFWADIRSRYPILTWSDYLRKIGGALEPNKVKAATEYLHESGSLMYFPAGTLKGGSLSGESLVVLHPEWFWKKMVEYILLPEPPEATGELSLRTSMSPDGSIFLPAFQAHIRRNLKIDVHQAEEVITMLTSLELAYKIREDRIFIPSLLEKDLVPGHWSHGRPGQWVMGFSLVLGEPSSTLLPISILRQLQVRLSRHPDFGHRLNDNHFVAGKSMISFTSKGMAMAVQYIAYPTSRLDTLVRPMSLADEQQDYREMQVNIAKKLLEIVVQITDRSCPTDSIVHISEKLCPGIDFAIKVMKPWSTEEGLKPVKLRDLKVSVKDVEEWMRKGADKPSQLNVERETVLGGQLETSKELVYMKRTTYDHDKVLVDRRARVMNMAM